MALFGKKDEVDSATDSAPESNTSQRAANSTHSSSSHKSARGAHQEGTVVANIGKSIAIKGDLTGNEDMVIEGSVDGTIDLPNNLLTIGANGTIRAEIHAKSVLVVGHVIGNIVGIERVEIQSSGRVEGNVTAPKLVVAEGAQLDGSIQMTGTAAGLATSNTPNNPARATPTAVAADEVRKAG